MSTSKQKKPSTNKDSNSESPKKESSQKSLSINEEENNEYDPNDINDINADINPEKEISLSKFKEKTRRSGVLYLSRIPVGMKPQDLRKLLDDYGMKRCYLVPLKNKLETIDGQKVQAYKEGWVEFDDKIYAKLAEYQLNGRKIGGSKKCPYKDELWNLKYLHKFKWNNLIENITMEKKIIEKKLKTEIAQSKRESDFIVKNYEKSKRYLNKKTNENNTEENNTSEKNDNEKNFDKKNYTKYKQKKIINK